MKYPALIGLCAALYVTPLVADNEANDDNNGLVFTAAKTAVIAELKDPDSARFGTLIRATRPNVRGEPMDVVCGQVNARNSYGGYSGMSGFVYFVGDKTLYFADGSGIVPGLGTTVFNRFCPLR